jgi:hypothetical protein
MKQACYPPFGRHHWYFRCSRPIGCVCPFSTLIGWKLGLRLKIDVKNESNKTGPIRRSTNWHQLHRRPYDFLTELQHEDSRHRMTLHARCFVTLNGLLTSVFLIIPLLYNNRTSAIITRNLGLQQATLCYLTTTHNENVTAGMENPFNATNLRCHVIFGSSLLSWYRERSRRCEVSS